MRDKRETATRPNHSIRRIEGKIGNRMFYSTGTGTEPSKMRPRPKDLSGRDGGNIGLDGGT